MGWPKIWFDPSWSTFTLRAWTWAFWVWNIFSVFIDSQVQVWVQKDPLKSDLDRRFGSVESDWSWFGHFRVLVRYALAQNMVWSILMDVRLSSFMKGLDLGILGIERLFGFHRQLGTGLGPERSVEVRFRPQLYKLHWVLVWVQPVYIPNVGCECP